MSKEEVEGVGLEYWMQWQVAVCGLIIIIPLVVASIVIKRQRSSIRPADLWVPCWRNLHPRWLLLYRVLAFAIMAYLLYLTVASFGISAFFFYTQWTFALVTVYLGLGTIISTRGCWMYSRNPVPRPRSEERDKFVNKSEENTTATTTAAATTTTTYEAQKQGRRHYNQHQEQPSSGLLETCMQIVYQICAGAVVITDIVFWCILVPFVMRDSFEITLLIGCMHSVNAVVLLLDSAFNSLPFTWKGLTYLVLWSCSYVIFQWMIHACCISWWPYPFLELSTPWAPLWYLALALIHVPCYALYMLLVKAKNSLFSTIFPHAFIIRVPVEKKQT